MLSVNTTLRSRSPSPSPSVPSPAPSATFTTTPLTPIMDVSQTHITSSASGSSPIISVAVPATVQDLPPIKCCCGRHDCEIYKNNCSILSLVEDDMRAAAQLGQALLHRHETYMAEAERERVALEARIQELQNDKKALEAENDRTSRENQSLMKQIDILNDSVQDADIKIQQLEASLLTSQQTVRKLEGATARAADMERQIAVLEHEQDTLRENHRKSEADNRDAMQRWRRAERNIMQLQEQIERMEQEAREERERHVEILGRMERQREVEKELNTAAGRLKGAAAAKTLSSVDSLPTGDKNGSNVVSHFVRDLLADNANLQLGMSELRELLMNSHDEIQALREQLVSHQPMAQPGSTTAPSIAATENPESTPQSPSLQNFPGGAPPQREVHVHHHYHVAQPKRTALKSTKKKRNSLVPGMFNPPNSQNGSGFGALRSAVTSPGHSRRTSISQSELGSDGGLMSPTQEVGMRGHKQRDSVASSIWAHNKRDSLNTVVTSNRRDSIFSERPSEYADSSVASSPVSSRPTSFMNDAEFALTCPPGRKHKKRVSDMSVCVNQAGIHAIAEEDDAKSLSGVTRRETSMSIAEELAGLSDENEFSFGGDADDETFDDEEEESESMDDLSPLPATLKRVPSHESIISISGLDIHTLKSRPGQLTLRPLGTASAVITDVVAQSTISYRPSSDIRSSLAGLAGRGGMHGSDSASIYSSSPNNNTDMPKARGGGWSKWVPWGGYTSSTSASSAVTSTEDSSSAPSSVASDNGITPTQTPVRQNKGKSKAGGDESGGLGSSPSAFFRTPGVNQPGFIPGYWAGAKTKGMAAKALADTMAGHQ